MASTAESPPAQGQSSSRPVSRQHDLEAEIATVEAAAAAARRGSRARTPSAHGQPVAEAQIQLENEAPIRGLAKQMSRLEITQKPKKSNPSHHRISGDSGQKGTWLSSHTRTPSRAQPTASAIHAATELGVPPITAPGAPETSNRLSGGASSHGSGVLAALGLGGIQGSHGTEAAPEVGGLAAPGVVGLAAPETPPPLKGHTRRASLVNNDVEEDPAKDIEQDLMIGEIKDISMNEELALIRKASVVICLSLLTAILVRKFAGPVAEGTNIILMVSFVAVLLLSFPVIRFLARLFAYAVTTRASSLLYRGNRYYFVVALHFDIAITVWSTFSVVFWTQMFYSWVYTDTEYVSRIIHDYGYKILQCHLALRVGIFVKNFLVLLVATSYLWRPYLQRVQSSILAQYILLMLTDYCTKGACNPGDQQFALAMGKQGIQENKHISLYAVSKAMGFIPRNKLGHKFFRNLAGSDTLDSSKDAMLLGNYLFKELFLRSRPPPTPSPRRGMSLAEQGGGDPEPNRTHPREINPFSQTRRLSRFTADKRHSKPRSRGFFESSPASRSANVPTAQDLKGTGDGGEDGYDDDSDHDKTKLGSAPVIFDSFMNSIGKIMTAGERVFGSHSSSNGGGSDGASKSGGTRLHEQLDTQDAAIVDQDQTQNSSSVDGGSGDGSGVDGSGSGGGGGWGGKMSMVAEESENWTASENEFSFEAGTAANARGGASGDADAAEAANGDKKDPGEGTPVEASVSPIVTSENHTHGEAKEGGDNEDSEESQDEVMSSSSEGDESEVLTVATFCPALDPDLLDVAFKIFDHNANGTITKEEMVHGVVGTFQDHRSLALTLQDSEHVARKLGLIFMTLVIFILVFVWLSIWGADVVQLIVSFASFLIAISFMIGTTASNLVTSVLFIFVTRLYDVGDRVHIYNDGEMSSTPANLVVVKIELRTTVFKRWDEQVVYIPNHLLASKTIVNIQRTAHQWHEFWINVAANTPSSKIKALQTYLQNFAKNKDKPEGLYPRMGFSLASIQDSNRLNIRITFRQRGNWQSMEKKWACQSMCTWAIKNGCESIGISYALPEMPIRINQKLL